jgi:hypothetical protein
MLFYVIQKVHNCIIFMVCYHISLQDTSVAPITEIHTSANLLLSTGNKNVAAFTPNYLKIGKRIHKQHMFPDSIFVS